MNRLAVQVNYEITGRENARIFERCRAQRCANVIAQVSEITRFI
jgi:hypothetical protein